MVKELRERTQAPMMECKSALDASQGDMDGAIKVLRERGIAKMAKRADRDTFEGVVRVAVGAGNRGGAAVLVSCETDFSARNDKFQALAQAALDAAMASDAASASPEAVLACCGGKVKALLDDVANTIRENMAIRRVVRTEGISGAYQHFDNKSCGIVEVAAEGDVGSEAFAKVLRELCMHIVAATPAPLAVDAAGIPEKDLATEREICIKQALESGKPQAIAEKMVGGRLQKFVAERALLEQECVLDPDQKVGAWLSAQAKSVGVTNVRVLRFSRIRIGE
jgi:elongation factor Ts